VVLVRVELEAGLWGRDHQQAVERVGERLAAVDAPRVGGEPMGRWNWWAPPSLRRLHDRFGLVEPPAPPRREDQERVGSLHADP
jgi:hypothetical protein